MSRSLVIAFKSHEAAQLAGFAQTLASPFDVLVLDKDLPSSIGAEKVFRAAEAHDAPADGLAKALAPKCEGYTHIASVSNMRSKDVLARLAGLLDAAMVTDVVGVESPTVFRRPIVAGSLIATVEALTSPVFLTVRPAAFPPVISDGVAPEVSDLNLDIQSRVTRSAVSARSGSRPDLSQAKVVVSGGRPLKDAQTFESVIGGLADALGGAVGATRAAVDSGIAANELQVGQTGKIVAPDLYIAAGISGSTQHMAGIKDSKVIVAINKDPDAPIFEVADYGLVADLFEAIPELREKIGK